jgi:hypothetical protein
LSAIGRETGSATRTYMKPGDYKLGLLINFNVVKLKNGIRRLINGKI